MSHQVGCFGWRSDSCDAQPYTSSRLQDCLRTYLTALNPPKYRAKREAEHLRSKRSAAPQVPATRGPRPRAAGQLDIRPAPCRRSI